MDEMLRYFVENVDACAVVDTVVAAAEFALADMRFRGTGLQCLLDGDTPRHTLPESTGSPSFDKPGGGVVNLDGGGRCAS